MRSGLLPSSLGTSSCACWKLAAGADRRRDTRPPGGLPPGIWLQFEFRRGDASRSAKMSSVDAADEVDQTLDELWSQEIMLVRCEALQAPLWVRKLQ